MMTHPLFVHALSYAAHGMPQHLIYHVVFDMKDGRDYKEILQSQYSVHTHSLKVHD